MTKQIKLGPNTQIGGVGAGGDVLTVGTQIPVPLADRLVATGKAEFVEAEAPVIKPEPATGKPPETELDPSPPDFSDEEIEAAASLIETGLALEVLHIREPAKVFFSSKKLGETAGDAIQFLLENEEYRTQVEAKIAEAEVKTTEEAE